MNLYSDSIQSVNLGMAAFNLASFAWAMKAYFRPPVGGEKGVRTIYIAGGISSLLTLAAYLFIVPKIEQIKVLATVIYLLSTVLFYWTVTSNKKGSLAFAFTQENPTKLISVGPYSYIRHPFYTSYSLTWLAGVLAIQHWILLLPLTVMGVLYIKAAKLEEYQFISDSCLSNDYKAYRDSTGMFYPKISARRP